MKSPLRRRRLSNSTRNRIDLTIVIAVLSGVMAIVSPVLSPGGWGITEGLSVTTKVVQELPENTTKETIVTNNSGKTVWDWLSLLGVPLSLFLLGVWVQTLQQKQTAAEKREQRKQSEYEMKEEVLQGYFDRISTLLVDKNLLGIATKRDASSEDQELLAAAVNIIRARTLSILRRFESDGNLKGHVIRFLIDTEVISKLKLNLCGADLSGANLREANFRGANLGGTNFSHANLTCASFDNAFLNTTSFIGADLSYASLFNAYLSRANLSGANLSRALLSGSRLVGSNLSRATLKGTVFGSHTIDSVQFNGKLIKGMQFKSAVLIEADLSSITSDDETEWPDAEIVSKAKNIPEILKQKLKA